MKLKTHKATAKKIKLSRPKKKNGRKAKLLTKTSGQDHFNAREPGKVGRAKRRGKQAAAADQKNIKRQLPYA
ncbi:hypothetical protein CL634_09465 [bacterium]|nr:hypothetical protein [bacterium]